MTVTNQFRSFGRFAVIWPGTILLLSWQIIAHTVDHGTFLFGSPSAVFSVAIHDLQMADIYRDIALTTAETVVGLLWGSLLGTLCGLLLWVDSRVGQLCEPYIVIAGSIPIVAIAPILIDWFGTGFLAKVILAGSSTLLISVIQAHEGAKLADKEKLEFARALKASRPFMVRKVILPSACMWVLAGFRLNVGFALIGAFIGEFVSSEAGVGRYIVRFGSLYDIPRVLFGVALLGLIGLVITRLVAFAVHLWVPAPLRTNNVSSE